METNKIPGSCPQDETTLEYGRYCKDNGDYRRAAEIFKALIPLADKVAKGCLYRELAFVLEKTGRVEDAISALQSALEIDNNDGDALEMIGRAYRRQKDSERALVHMTRALEIRNGDPRSQPSREWFFRIHGELAGIYHEKGDHQKALSAIREALRYQSHDFRAHYDIVSLLFLLDCREDAVTEIKGRIDSIGRDKSSQRSQRCRELAVLCYENGEFELARHCLENLLDTIDENNVFERNKVFNRLEYLMGKTVIESRPLRMQICLTRKCNLNCIMCYDKYRQEWELPQKTVEEIESYFPCLEYVQWRGGEVFLYKSFRELFDKAALYPRLCQDIVTNGTLVTEEWAEKIIRTGTKLSLSIDGVHKDTYEKIRRGARFEDVLRTLRMLKHYRALIQKPKFRPELFMNFVVLRSNYKDVEDIIDFAVENGIEFVQTVAGDTSDFPQTDPFKNEDIRNDAEIIRYLQERLPAMHQKAKKFGVKYRNFFPDDACSADEKVEPKVSAEPVPKRPKRPMGYCRAPWDSLFVFLFDTVKPHCFCDAVIGDIKDEKLEAMWNNPVMQQYRKKVSGRDITDFCSQRCRKQEPFENMGLNL